MTSFRTYFGAFVTFLSFLSNKISSEIIFVADSMKVIRMYNYIWPIHKVRTKNLQGIKFTFGVFKNQFKCQRNCFIQYLFV